MTSEDIHVDIQGIL